MADILIRGMEMPKSGYVEMLLKVADGEVYYNYAGEREIKSADYIPLPEGHGRLIDGDVLVSKYTEEINKSEEWAKIHEKEGRLEMFRACHLRSAYLAEAKLNIKAAPTIVPAEGGTDYDGNA